MRMKGRRLERIEEQIFSIFRSNNTPRLLTKEVFDGLPEISNADLVRAFEDLEERQRLVVRFTHDGFDWISLTPQGIARGRLTNVDENTPSVPFPHPPKSSTSPMM